MKHWCLIIKFVHNMFQIFQGQLGINSIKEIHHLLSWQGLRILGISEEDLHTQVSIFFEWPLSELQY